MRQLYHFAFFDEASKREIRRAILKGIAIPGHQIPFASREMPIGRGWGHWRPSGDVGSHRT